MTAGASSLRRLARPTARTPASRRDACQLCGEPLEPVHRHVADVQARALLCICRGCTILFSRTGAGGAHFRLVGERRLALPGFRLDDAQWAGLRIPVDVAFFLRSSAAGRVVAVYPGALGATESQLELETWQELTAANPILDTLEDDVEALLADRRGARPEHFLVPIDDCYTLAGIVRTHWRGLAGGDAVWRELDLFFERLRARATTLWARDREESSCRL